MQHKGYLFFRHYEAGDKSYWRCQFTGAGRRCFARLVITGSSEVSEKGFHNHSIPSS